MNNVLRLACLWAVLALALPAAAQRELFLYFQTEDLQPFYVQVAGKNYSSSQGGYLVIPKVASGHYDLRVGFAGNSAPQEYQIALQDKDQGYLIKNFGEKGWALYNLQNAQVQYASEIARKKREAELARQKAVADSIARVMEQRRQDSLQAVAQREAEAQRLRQQAEAEAIARQQARADSLAKLAERRRLDSLDALAQKQAEAQRKLELAAAEAKAKQEAEELRKKEQADALARRQAEEQRKKEEADALARQKTEEEKRKQQAEAELLIQRQAAAEKTAREAEQRRLDSLEALATKARSNANGSTPSQTTTPPKPSSTTAPPTANATKTPEQNKYDSIINAAIRNVEKRRRDSAEAAAR
ncbi:MAG TPA: hypothetical protein PKD90_08440, partial [Phnomibacter sp.]|nr:hypothetical protein [Phnomibacter sp.]